MATSYSELLKDPRWQRKRLEILDRDNFTCVSCGCSDKTLHVHHHYYIEGRKPWEYNDCMLVTLCGQCHQNEEGFKECDGDVVRVLLCSGLLRWDLQKLISRVHERAPHNNPAEVRRIFDVLMEQLIEEV